MAKPLEDAKIVKSTASAVRIKARDGETPVNVLVEGSALDGHFGLSGSSPEVHRRIVEANFREIMRIADQCYRAGDWSEGFALGGRYREIYLRSGDFADVALVRPD